VACNGHADHASWAWLTADRLHRCGHNLTFCHSAPYLQQKRRRSAQEGCGREG